MRLPGNSHSLECRFNLLVGGLWLINLRGLVARLAQVKTYPKGAPFYNALIRHVARAVLRLSCMWLKMKSLKETGALLERRQATNPAGRGLGLTTLRKVTKADQGS